MDVGETKKRQNNEASIIQSDRVAVMLGRVYANVVHESTFFGNV
jgi:hypothetical protein